MDRRVNTARERYWWMKKDRLVTGSWKTMNRSKTRHALSPKGRSDPRRPLVLHVYPDSILRAQCEPVERFDGDLEDRTQGMLELMRGHKGIGLAGPQAGVAQRLFVAEWQGVTLCLVNPVIVERSGRDRMSEGCLSLPGMSVRIERDLEVKVQGYDIRGNRQAYRLEGLWARVVQHEVDHLDGILICDHHPPKEQA